MDTPELQALIGWLRREVQPLLDSGDTWQVTLHGGPAGDVKAEVNRKQCLLATQKERQRELVGAQANGAR